MKKIFSILSAGLLGLMAVSCLPEQLAVFDPTNATAPVLGTVAVGAKNVSVNYTPGEFHLGFNDKMTPTHTLALTGVDGKAVSRIISSKDNGATLLATNVNISKALQFFGYSDGQTVSSLDIVVRATIQDPSKDNGRNGFVDSEKYTISNFTVTLPQGSPYADYTESSTWSVIGALSNYDISWNGDLEMFATEDGNHLVAKAVKLSKDDEFKFRKDLAWDVNMGGEFAGLDTEFSVAQDGANIKVGADGVYDLWLDLDAGTAMVTDAYMAYPDHKEASTWTVIGALSNYDISWNGDLPMITDGKTHVAQGVKLSADDEFKFRKDKAWDVNMGGEFGGLGSEFTVTQDGANIKVGADGIYDLILDPNGSATIVETLGGGVSNKIGGDEPDKPQMWSLIGTLDGSAWDKDFDMSNTTGDIWVIRSVKVLASDEFKIRADHDWGQNVGGPEENSSSTIDPANPYGVFKPELGVAFEAKDKNIQIGKEGIFDITFDYAAMTILVEEHVAAYSLIGQVNGSSWDQDFVMTEKDGVWISPVVTIDGKFKIRYDYSWDDANVFGLQDGGTTLVGTPFTAGQPGSDMELAKGDYTVQFTPATKEVLIQTVDFPTQLFMIGEEFGGWDWSSDGVVEMTPVVHNPEWGTNAEGQFWTVRYISAGKGFKFNSKREWGGDFWGLDTNEGFKEDGGNCTVEADGFYMIHVDTKRSIVHVEPARIYGIGNCFGGWTEGMEDALFTADGKTLKATAAGDGELRMYAASSISTSDWWTREFVILDGKIDYRGDDEGQGDQARVNVQKGQVVTLDFNAGTGSISGEGEAPELPETMYMIGEAIGGWEWTGDYIVDMTPVNGKAGQFWAIRYIEAGKGFKFCAVKEWNGDFTGLGEDTGYTVEGGNCSVAESGVYMFYVDTDNKKLCVEKAKVYGIGDCFGGWDAKMEGALFEEKDGTLVGKTTAAGEIRMYAESSIATSDWWTREFVFFDGKIAYRGNGGDQDRVSVEADKTVTLDFNAGTAVVE